LEQTHNIPIDVIHNRRLLQKTTILSIEPTQQRRFHAKYAICRHVGFSTVEGMAIRQHFTEHPASVGETYGQHFRVAAGFAGSLAVAAAGAAVHAVVPSWCSATASSRIVELHEQMTSGARGVAHHPGKNRPVRAA
jgi:hypothetical protein